MLTRCHSGERDVIGARFTGARAVHQLTQTREPGTSIFLAAVEEAARGSQDGEIVAKRTHGKPVHVVLRVGEQHERARGIMILRP